MAVFRQYESDIATETNDKGLKSDDVLALLGPDLAKLGFQVEASKKKVDELQRPVFFGENGIPTLRYEIDGYHPQWKCGLEIEAGRGWMGNAVYRDLVQAAVMVGVEHLCLAVANVYTLPAKDPQMVGRMRPGNSLRLRGIVLPRTSVNKGGTRGQGSF